MLVLISSILIVAYTIFFCIHTASKKQCVSSTTGKCVSMALGMVSSTMIGLLLALLLPGELAYSTVLSIVVSGVFAIFIGKYFGVSGIIEALSASFMGAMMGAMLGDMTPENRETFIIVAMDIIYLLAVVSLMLMVNKEAIQGNEMIKTRLTPLFLSLILSISVIGIGATIETNAQDLDETPQMNHEHHH
jgi:glucan phosphoethanolaminetransferase (alkaline phosphatase superfamily)